MVKTSVEIDNDLNQEVERASKLIKEKPATVLRMAIRAGLPLVINRHQEPRPDGYFANTYKHWPKERLALEEAFSKEKVSPQRPE